MILASNLWVPLVALAIVCISGCGAKRSGSAVDGQLAELEQRVSTLRAESARRDAAIESAFAEVTRAEAAAGLSEQGCGAIVGASAPKTLPRAGHYARVSIGPKTSRVGATFSASKKAGALRLVPGRCEVAR
jgi:hypothetical protein